MTFLKISRAAAVSYAILFLTIVLVASLKLATPLLAVLFAYFALTKLDFFGKKPMAILLFLAVVLGLFSGFSYFLKQAIVGLPALADTSVPKIIQFANDQGVDLPFDDVDGLKSLAIENVRHQLSHLGNFAKIATKEFVFIVIGIVVAISLFVNPAMDLDRHNHRIPDNLYTLVCDEISLRFSSLYRSFATVMGAQLVISTINTGMTAIFVSAIHLPYATVILGLTFLCGLLPIAGNLISNSVVVAVAFTISPRAAISCLVFLVVLHKVEYFLNSKIIGDRIKNPVWLTLLGLIIGERLMGVPGMILAPVLLNFIKEEASRIEVNDPLAAPKASSGVNI